MYERIFMVARKIRVRLYTLLQRPRFARLGRHAVIHPPILMTSPDSISIGDGTVIMEHAFLNVKPGAGSASLTIGDRVYVGRFAHINALKNVVIEDDVLINHKVTLGDESHRFEDTTVPILSQGTFFDGGVLLRRGCWIGTGSIIMPGVTVGRNSVVGANSVVTADVPDYTVVAGAPAREIRKLKP